MQILPQASWGYVVVGPSALLYSTDATYRSFWIFGNIPNFNIVIWSTYNHRNHHHYCRAEWVHPVVDWTVEHINSGSFAVIVIIIISKLINDHDKYVNVDNCFHKFYKAVHNGEIIEMCSHPKHQSSLSGTHALILLQIRLLSTLKWRWTLHSCIYQHIGGSSHTFAPCINLADIRE